MQEILKKHKVSNKRFSEELCIYLKKEWNDAFYQRVNRIVRGDDEPTQMELDATNKWLQAVESPHEIHQRLIDFEQAGPKVDFLYRKMRSGIYNSTEMDRTFRSIKSLFG